MQPSGTRSVTGLGSGVLLIWLWGIFHAWAQSKSMLWVPEMPVEVAAVVAGVAVKLAETRWSK